MGFSAVAAVVAGTADAAMTLSAVAEIGTAMTVVGAVTGSKDLMKIGGVMGLAGWGGSMALGAGDAATAGAGLTGDAVPSTGSMTQAGDYGMNAAQDAAGNTAADAGSTVASSVSDPMSGLTQKSLPDLTNSDDAIDMASNQGYASLGGDNPFNVDPLGTGTKGATQQPMASGSSATGTSASGSPSTAGTGQNSALSSGGSISNSSQDNALLKSNAGYGDTAPIPGNSFFSNMLDWAQKNQPLANGLAKLGAGALQGMGQAYESNRKYQLGVDQLALQQQQARNANSLPTIGILAGARA